MKSLGPFLGLVLTLAGCNATEPAEELEIASCKETETQSLECESTTLILTCGNFVLNEGEECDFGREGQPHPNEPNTVGLNSDTTPNACRTNCTLPRCGDDVVDNASGETCDDGNTLDGDGCDQDCQSERICNAEADETIFSDGNFDSNTWSSAAYLGPAEATFSTQQMPSGGNSGNYYSVDLSSGGNGTVWTLHLNNDAKYSPSSSGTVESLAVSFDVSSSQTAPPNSLQTAFSFAVLQDGILYWTERVFTEQSQGWVSKNDWSEQDFREFPDMERTSTPDFTSGSELHFGFLVGVSGDRTDSGVDNWRVVICSE